MHIRFRLNFIIFLFIQPALVFGGNRLQGKHHKYNAMKLLRSFVHAFNGIRLSFASELNFRIHAVAALLVTILSAALDIAVFEWLLVGFCIAFVIVVEMLNTAIEKLCDVVQPEVNPVIKKVKDIAAGAVLVAAIFCVIAGLIIFVPKIIEYLKSF